MEGLSALPVESYLRSNTKWRTHYLLPALFFLPVFSLQLQIKPFTESVKEIDASVWWYFL